MIKQDYKMTFSMQRLSFEKVRLFTKSRPVRYDTPLTIGPNSKGQDSPFSLSPAGGPRAYLHGDLHHRDVHQDLGLGLHPTQEQLHAQPLEHHGFCRRRLRVSHYRQRARLFCPLRTTGLYVQCSSL